MSQADYVIDDQSGADFLSELNDHLKAIVSNNKGAGRPTTTYAGQQWVDDDYGTDVWAVYQVVDPANSSLDALVGTIDTSTGKWLSRGAGLTDTSTATEYKLVVTDGNLYLEEV